MTRAEVSIKDERVEAGDHVTLDCRVAIDPLLKSSVTWLKDNVEIDLKDDNFHLGQRGMGMRAQHFRLLKQILKKKKLNVKIRMSFRMVLMIFLA